MSDTRHEESPLCAECPNRGPLTRLMARVGLNEAGVDCDGPVSMVVEGHVYVDKTTGYYDERVVTIGGVCPRDIPEGYDEKIAQFERVKKEQQQKLADEIRANMSPDETRAAADQDILPRDP